MKITFTILLLFNLLQSFAQNLNNIWYFGTNAGVDFNSGTPLALTNGQIPMSEGCTSICDSSGNLLFYSDGVDVWNKNHTLMPNGSSLKGGYSMTQSIIAIPKPGSYNLYYLFTVQPIYGIHYSELDMNLNAGLGDINSNKNIQIGNNTVEKLTAVRHQNGIDYWIITHESYSNNFNVYLVNSAGVYLTPVISSVGTSLNSISEAGYLKASPNGELLASALFYMDTVEIFDFNKTTGQITNPRALNGFLYYGAYGLEFSPSNQFLYVSDANDSISNLYQYDLTDPNIESTKTLITTLQGYTGALQLAPNGKIYICVADSLYLSSIENPNGSGLTCNYLHNSLYMGGQSTFIGLPNYVNDSFNSLLNVPEFSQIKKTLVRIVDILGRPAENKPNTLLICIYNDGTTEKIFRIK